MHPRLDSAPPRERDLERRLLLHCLIAAARARDPETVVSSLLPYLECFPLGKYNRAVAQRIEELLLSARLSSETRSALHSRFRRLRDPYMPSINDRI